MQKMKLSVVIVNYNVKFFLEQCLLSVLEAVRDIDAEVLVVDNASSDGSVGYLRPKFPSVVFVENADNLGFAKANNLAMRQSCGEYVLLLNPDTFIGDSLRRLCRFMDESDEVGAIGVKMLNPHGAFLPESKRCFPSPWVAFCKLFGLSKLFPMSRRFAAYSLPYLNSDAPHSVEVLAGAFMLLRRKALDKVGLFDESFFMYGEDIDLSYRIVLAGYKNFYLPERILHYKGESTTYADRKYLNAFYDAMLIFFKKYYPDSRMMLVLISSSVFLRKAFSAIFGWKRCSKRKIRNQKVLVMGRPASFDEELAVLQEKFPRVSVDMFDVSESSELEMFVKVGGYTDVVFIYPDMGFDRMLSLMDRQPDKTIVYHTFYPARNLMVSPSM